MKKNIFIITTLFIFSIALLTSCEKKVEVSTDLPDCVEDILEDSILSKDLKTIRIQMVDGQPHYWLNTDYMFFDGGEFVIDASCDTTCVLCGECFPPACNDNYVFEDWLIIWEK